MAVPGQGRAERRLAAILVADVAGYSRLTGLDEEGTLDRLRKLRRELINPAVSLYRGRVVKTTGDGILVEFPSVVDAVRCALDVQRGVKSRNAELPREQPIEFRVGINIGDVVVDGEDLLGDGVNVAARLESFAEPGCVCLSEDAYRQVRDKLDISFEDAGEQQFKNIMRPVRVYRVQVEGGTRARPPLPLPDKPSIAVLPFQNLSGDPEQEYFADGMAEDIITELSRYPDLFVVARNSSFTYRGKTIRVTEVARELGVQFVLEGSVRRDSNRVRITAQFVDALSGNHLWAQRYDRSLEDLFSVQDDVAQSIVAVLPARVEAAALERASRKTSNSLDAYDYFLRGKYCHHLENQEANREALAHFDHSIELDPRFASAYAWKACTLGQGWIHEFRPRTPERAEEISQLIQTAMRLDENDTECHRMIARLALIQGQFAKSDHHLTHALTLNPNDPRLIVQRGINLTFLGDPEAAIPWIERAMRIDPFSASRYYLDLARALFAAERPGEAVDVLQRTMHPHYEHYVWLAASYAAIGAEKGARQAAEHALTLRPGLSAGSYTDTGFAWNRVEDKNRLRDALVRAGLPA